MNEMCESSCDLLNCESYLINLKKDYGRYIFSSDLIDIFNPKIFEGNDCNIIDENGYLNKIFDSVTYTKSAKKTKKKLLEHFLKTSEKKYLIVFEDDVYLHADLFDPIKKQNVFNKLNVFLNIVSPKLLYLGNSRHFTSEKLYTQEMCFQSVFDKFGTTFDMCSGAYAFIIRRDIIPTVLMRINNDTIENMPFDLFCLSYIAKMYPKECYVTNPHIIVPNVEGSNIRNSYSQLTVWKSLETQEKLYYTDKIMGIMIVDCYEQNKCDIDYFNKMIMCLTPTIKIHYWNDINDVEKRKQIEKILNKKKIVIECSANIKIKYMSGKDILSSFIKYFGTLDFLTIYSKKNINNVLFKVTYNNKFEKKKSIVLDI